jgi:predicted molibdopterin-dependent oxidoreductase YjgC
VTERVSIVVDGETIPAIAGTPLGALLHARDATLRHTVREHAPRGIFCGMGVCFDCLVEVDGRPNVRACVTAIRDGMCVTRS